MKCCAVQNNQLKPDRGKSGSRPSCTATLSGFFIGDFTMTTRICRKCETENSITEFDKHPDGRDGRLNICKSCNYITRRKRESLPKVKAHIKKVQQKRRIYLKQQKLCYQCAKKSVVKDKILCSECSQKTKIRMFHQRNKLRETVLSYYGGAKCIVCGETRKLCLTIDHINNDGAEHRKITGGGGYNTYCWLKRNNYPKGFQVLCRNCNWIKHAELFYGEENGV